MFEYIIYEYVYKINLSLYFCLYITIDVSIDILYTYNL